MENKPTKIELIAKFLETLKVLHKTGDADFEIFCSKCGGKNCRIYFFSDLWAVAHQGDTPVAQVSECLEQAIGLKCLDCGFAKNREYDESQELYG